MLQLADEGRIDVRAPVTDYLPWFVIRSEFEPIRLHNLLSHTAGITSGIDFAPSGAIQVWGLRDPVATTPPGTSFRSSDMGYKVLGEVLRAVTGEPYGSTIQTRIFDPLGLVDSVPTITHDVRPRLAVGYGPLRDERPWWPGRPLAPAAWLETDTADGCLAMTAADLVRYLRMVLRRGEVDGKRVLSDDGFTRFTQRAIATDEPPARSWYGYGINTSIGDGHTLLWHGGGMVGYFSGMIGDLDTGVGVVALVNGPGAPNSIARTTLAFVNASVDGTPFAFPGLDDPMRIEAAAEVAGDYVAGDYVAGEGHDGPARLRIDADGPALTLTVAGRETRLRSNGPDVFVTDAVPLARFPLRLHRGDDLDRHLSYGDTLYRPVSLAIPAPAPEPVDRPAEWAAYPGPYRSHNPRTPMFRGVARQGRPWLAVP